jgi:LysR family glycine cleavage system transcriptional activator
MIADMVIVAAPSVIAGSMISHAADLIDLPWLQELGTNEVAQWMASHGVDLDRPMSISHMPGNLIMDSVRRGDGITYTARPFVDKEIQSGELVELFCDPALGQYYIKTRPGILRPSAKAFVSWLKEQAAKDLE